MKERNVLFGIALGLVILVVVVAFVTSCTQQEPVAPVTPPAVTTNQAPLAYAPFTVTSDFSWGARVDYDLRYRLHGCDKEGNPTSATGAIDWDGDELEYKVSCQWSIFNAAKEKINDKWVTFKKDDKGEQKAIVTLFIGRTADVEPYPFEPKCVAHVIEVPVAFSYTVRDGHGHTASSTVLIPGAKQ